MGTIHVTWVQGKTFIGTDSTNHSVVISSPADGVGMKPSDLLLVALASCTAYDVVNILEKKHAHITGVQVSAAGEQLPEAPWTFTKIHLRYVVTGIDVKAEDVAKAIELSEQKYCSVSATLKATVDITYDFEVQEAAAYAHQP